MDLSKEEFNILLDILYYLRKKKGESSDFYCTYVNGQERFKLYNIDSDKIDLELKGFNEIDCSKLSINEKFEGDFNNVISGIEKYDNIDMEDIKGSKDQVEGKKERLDKNFYEQIKRLVFSFKGSDDKEGSDIGNAKKFKIMNDLDQIFNDFNATGDKRLELELSGFCNITGSSINKERFKIVGEFNSNSEFEGLKIAKTIKKDKVAKEEEKRIERERIEREGNEADREKVSIDKLIDKIFQSKQNLLLDIFKSLRDEGKIEFREGKETKIVPGFNDAFDKKLTEELIKSLQENLIEENKEKYDIGKFKLSLRKRFRKEVERARANDKENTLFGEVVEYSNIEMKKNSIKRLNISKGCKKLIIDNMEKESMSKLIEEYRKDEEIEEAVKKVVLEEVEAKLKADGFAEYKEMIEEIEAKREYCEKTFKMIEDLKNLLGIKTKIEK